MEKNKSNNLIVCIICGIMTVFGIAASIVSLVNGSSAPSLRSVTDVIYILMSVLIGYYVLFGYQKPHGNSLKYIILIYAASRLLSVYATSSVVYAWSAVSHAVIIGLCCYIAGRLHRAKQNMILMILVIVIMVISRFKLFVAGTSTIGAVTPLIIWLDICAAYFLRYKEHKLAGLTDTVN